LAFKIIIASLFENLAVNAKEFLPYNRLCQMSWLERINIFFQKIKQRSRLSYNKLRAFYLGLNKRSGGTIGIIRHAVTNFTIARGAEAAAALSYYAFFAIFPLLLVFISIGSYFLEREFVKQQVLETVIAVIPVSATLINNNIDSVLQLRGAVTTIALISLIWSASNLFYKIVMNVNRAFPGSKNPGFFHSRLIALILISILGLLFLLSIAATTLAQIIPALDLVLNGKTFHETVFWRIISPTVPFVIKFFLFWGIYTWVPRAKVIRGAAAISALTSAILWEVVTKGFTWLISSGFTNYQLVYGSLGTIVALLFWIFLTGQILLFGAHLTHAITYHVLHKSSQKV